MGISKHIYPLLLLSMITVFGFLQLKKDTTPYPDAGKVFVGLEVLVKNVTQDTIYYTRSGSSERMPLDVALLRFQQIHAGRLTRREYDLLTLWPPPFQKGDKLEVLCELDESITARELWERYKGTSNNISILPKVYTPVYGYVKTWKKK